jgi:5-methylcytosine-specific restriction endonuclease McrA
MTVQQPMVAAAKPKRRALSKKTRFEVFKRDRFACQYCGAHPPGVLLHVDHVVAVAEGGTNDMDNLVTACEPCNLGKGARDIGVAPKGLEEKAKETQEREAQLAGFQAIFEAKRPRGAGSMKRRGVSLRFCSGSA